MQINKLVNTCSMYELGDINESEAYNLTTNKILKKILDKYYYHAVKFSVIYNTNYKWFGSFEARLNLFLIGFRKVATYRGFNGRKVYVLLKKF